MRIRYFYPDSRFEDTGCGVVLDGVDMSVIEYTWHVDHLEYLFGEPHDALTIAAEIRYQPSLTGITRRVEIEPALCDDQIANYQMRIQRSR